MTVAATGAEHRRLTEKVAAFIRRAGEGATGESEFDDLAREVFAFQFAHIPPYRRLCLREARTPDTVRSWRAIPAVPAQAFKQYTLAACSPDAVVKTFCSSGTSEPGRSSRSHFTRIGLDLMDTAVAVNARRALFPDGRRTRILVLAPPPEKAPSTIMVHGMAHLIRTFGLEESRFLAGPGGIDPLAICDELDRCQREGVAVSLLGASFAFVHLFDWMEREGRRAALPPGSRLMDAGGYKGRSREIGRAEFVSWASSMTGVPPAGAINLLGMTEMASQIYDRIATEGEVVSRMKVPPAWVRTEVVDLRRTGPDGPEPVADGGVGMLRHFDLANVERPAAIQSEDIGRRVELPARTGSGFEVLGRARGAEPRGCSLSADDLHGSRAALGGTP